MIVSSIIGQERKIDKNKYHVSALRFIILLPLWKSRRVIRFRVLKTWKYNLKNLKQFLRFMERTNNSILIDICIAYSLVKQRLFNDL